MGETLFAQTHSHGHEQLVPFSELLASIEPYTTATAAQHSGWFDLTFSEAESCSISLDPDADDRISQFTVHRPCCDRRLYDILFHFMKQANWVLFSNGGDLFITANPSAVQHLPSGMVEGLGSPIIAQDLDSFFRAYLPVGDF